MANYSAAITRTTGASDPLVPEPVKGRRRMATPDAATMRKLQKQGKAIPNAKGQPSFQIRNGADLDNAIRAVGRVRPNTEAARSKVRRYLIQRAKALGLSSRIPDSWAGDGSLKSGGDDSNSGSNSQSKSPGPAKAGNKIDPDHDGDNDAYPSTDTDHDNWSKDGKPLTPMAKRLFAQRQKKNAA